MGKLGDLKKVPRDPAHQLTGAVFVKKGKGQGLHMVEKIPADIRLDPGPQQVAPVADDIGKDGLEEIGQKKNAHQDKKGVKKAPGQQFVEGSAGGDGEEKIDETHTQSAGHIQKEDGHMGLIVRQKNGNMRGNHIRNRRETV